jgi:hypothetical protein
MEVNGFRIGVITNIKQEMLAALVGTTRPRVNHFLNKFRKLGLIEYGGTLPQGEIRIRSIPGMYDGTGQS